LDRVFLDANVLFSAAYAAENCFLELWQRKGIRLLSSEYAVQEVKRNLAGVACLKRLKRLVAAMEILPGYAAMAADAPSAAHLPEKDRPILAAAIAARATHLLTGDRRHFGQWYGQRIGGVLIQSPAQYFQHQSRRYQSRRRKGV
jgi:predicted nucleic acid-binding protein